MKWCLVTGVFSGLIFSNELAAVMGDIYVIIANMKSCLIIWGISCLSNELTQVAGKHSWAV